MSLQVAIRVSSSSAESASPNVLIACVPIAKYVHRGLTPTDDGAAGAQWSTRRAILEFALAQRKTPSKISIVDSLLSSYSSALLRCRYSLHSLLYLGRTFDSV